MKTKNKNKKIDPNFVRFLFSVVTTNATLYNYYLFFTSTVIVVEKKKGNED